MWGEWKLESESKWYGRQILVLLFGWRMFLSTVWRHRSLLPYFSVVPHNLVSPTGIRTGGREGAWKVESEWMDRESGCSIGDDPSIRPHSLLPPLFVWLVTPVPLPSPFPISIAADIIIIIFYPIQISLYHTIRANNKNKKSRASNKEPMERAIAQYV